MATHTEGPWIVEETAGGPHGKFLSIGQGRGHDCVVQMVWTPRAMNETDYANANLIAAAPDMLDALTEILEEAEKREDVVDGENGEQRPNAWMRVAQIARAAIDKASPDAASRSLTESGR